MTYAMATRTGSVVIKKEADNLEEVVFGDIIGIRLAILFNSFINDF